MRSDEPRIGKKCSWRQIPLLNCQGDCTGRAEARLAGNPAKRSGNRNYRWQFRQIAISSPVYEQRLMVHDASSVANPICCSRSIGSPAMLNRAKRSTRRRHHKTRNRQQTQRPQRPSRASNSHHPWHPRITLRRPSACVNLTLLLRSEKTMLQLP